ncbi:MAG: YheU family protein [Myxococcota bacterium]|nr:YheU family protein [Myxococcota bacterium]
MSDDDGETRVVRDEEDATTGDDELPPDVVVPWERLSAAALRGVIEEFVTREGTEYGAQEVSLESKVAQVQRQLEREEVVVLFDGKTQSVNLVRATELKGR